VVVVVVVVPGPAVVVVVVPGPAVVVVVVVVGGVGLLACTEADAESFVPFVTFMVAVAEPVEPFGVDVGKVAVANTWPVDPGCKVPIENDVVPVAFMVEYDILIDTFAHG
jgi:hypothetical protein